MNARARRATTGLRARSAITSIAALSPRRSTAATPVSLYSVVIATASSSAGSVRRSSARGAHGVVHRVLGDGAERARLVQALERAERDLGVGRRARDLHQRALFAQRPRRERGARDVGAVERQRQQTRERVRADLRVDVAAGDHAERVGVGETGDGGAPHARRLVGSRERRDHAELGLGQRVERRDTHSRIGVLPRGLRAKAIEQGHRADYLGKHVSRAAARHKGCGEPCGRTH